MHRSMLINDLGWLVGSWNRLENILAVQTDVETDRMAYHLRD